MSTGNNYFNPIDINGLQVFTATGQSGWYQYDVPDPQVSTLPGITVPNGAGGMVVQANTELAYCFSPERAAVGTTAWMTLAAGGTLVLSGPAWIKQFCVRLGLVAGASFTVQFLRGNIGPIMEVNAPVTGGIIPPPPPGLSAIPTPNVIHVMPTGNDATGSPYRLDLPYATPAAAELVAAPLDTIMVWAGDYTNVALNGGNGDVNWHLVGAKFIDDGVNPIFNLTTGTTTIQGIGLLECFNGAVAAIEVLSSATLNLKVPVQSASIAVRNNSGTVNVEAEMQGLMDMQAGTNTIRGNIIGGIITDGALCNTTVFGNITGPVNANAGSSLKIFGNIIGDVQPTTSSILQVVGNITGQFIADGCIASMQGNVIGAVTSQNGAVQTVVGDVQGHVVADGGSQSITGTVTASKPVTAEAGATQTISGKVIITGGVGCFCGKAIQILHCDITSDLDCLQVDGDGTQRFTGRAESATGIGAYCIDGKQEVNGTLVSVANFGAQILEGKQRITGRIESCRAALTIEDDTANYTAILGAGTVLVANVGGVCGAAASVVTLTGQPVNVVCMGVYANLAFEPAVTALVQAPTVNGNVQ